MAFFPVENGGLLATLAIQLKMKVTWKKRTASSEEKTDKKRGKANLTFMKKEKY